MKKKERKKLEISISHECKHKNPEQNINKLNLMMYKNNYNITMK